MYLLVTHNLQEGVYLNYGWRHPRGSVRRASGFVLRRLFGSNPFGADGLVLTSVQLALARQDEKERRRAKMIGAGRMTATARAGIGARF